jgi:galactose mutarotase-like enzyme
MIHIGSGAARASVAPQGAEIMAWSVDGRPLLWAPDPAVWPEIAPLLFPVVGWTRNGEARVGGQTYPLALHGFARHRMFQVVACTGDAVRLELNSDVETRRLYPFDFALTVEHAVGEGALSTILTVANAGPEPMPYACGLHPGFRWPFAGGAPDDYRLRFEKPENPVVPRIAPGGLIARATRRLPTEGNLLPLSAALFDNDALCFLDAASKSLRFEAPNGAAIEIETEDFPHIGIWCRPGHGYLCIEQWTGFSDPELFAGDLFEKPSIRVLPPGGRARHAAHYRYKAAP